MQLHNAINSRQKRKTIKKLIEEGEDIDQQDNVGCTPLNLAVRTGHSKAVTLLIENHADLNIADTSGRTPLHWAIIGGHVEIAQKLIISGAITSLPDMLGNKPNDYIKEEHIKHEG